MTSTTKRRIAREWLIFLGLFSVGLVGLLVSFNMTLGHLDFPHPTALSWCFSELFENAGGGAIRCWLFVLAPYLLVQLIRSAVWAWKTIRNP
jgi:hypothetical protein